MKLTTADVSLSKDVFDEAVKSALGRVNTHGISDLTQYQLRGPCLIFSVVKILLSVCQPAMANR